MASRRPAPRTKVTGTLPAPSQNRTRSVSKAIPTPESHLANTLNSTVTSITSSLSQKNSEISESNIQVVIRCRRRSDREVQENSPIIVSSSGAKSKEISIELGAPQSSLGIVTLPPIRTYPFDLVFGPEADQALIYHDVVSPMLEEVLTGYNCTLFAYGQTGTGKTYTMHGDLKPTQMGNPSPDAGMIPRALFRLFHSLETTKADYSVKISYIELYNEELRDLLANDFAPPTGSTQPMGIGAKDKASEGLKIFDEAGKKGVFIQGLEEIAVKDCKDALALLTKGSERRQIAATRFNDHSSRSHSIFSITVHVKETSNVGDDLLKVGKLNLVDLAGSENIGRSGAENKRAREAGMINQSLLTLGRVINALVDNAQHVPYRESKLTRLLQDSLGGRTKTCIIATISPARSNMEETLSTLDYALRAKSIRNKPEVNQRMTRNGLLKEYIAEIERLKNDLLAAREKNGIFFSEDSWNQLNAEQELRQTELQEAKKQTEIVESQMRAVREEFEQSIGLLMKRDEELKETRGELKKTKVTLNYTEGQLQETKVALDEEVVMREAHQDTEVKLNVVAEELKNVAAESLRDIGGLFQKLERKSNVLESNSTTVSKCEKTISTLTEVISKKLADLHQSMAETATKLQTMAKESEATELEKLSAHSQTISEQLIQIQDAFSDIRDNDKTESEALQIAHSTLNEMQTTLKNEFVSWGASLTSTYSTICDDLQESSQKGMAAVEKALSDVHSVLEAVLREVQQYIKDELTLLKQSRHMANDAAQAEVIHLRQQNDALIQMLKYEKTKADKAKEMLMHRMSEMLDVFMDEQHSRLEDSMDGLRDQNVKAQGALESYLQQQGSLFDQMVGSGTSANAMLQKQNTSVKRIRDGTFKTLEHTKSAIKEKSQALRDQLSTSITSQTTRVTEKTSTYATSASQAFKQHSKAKRARLDTIHNLGQDIQSYYGQLQGDLASSSDSLGLTLDTITAETSSLLQRSSDHYGSLSNDLGALHAANQRLAEHGARPDMPTGATPQKKAWNYVDHWDLTQSREVLLRKNTAHGSASKRRNAHVAEDVPPFQDEDEEEAESEDVTEKLPVGTPVPTPHIPRSPTPSTSSGSTMVTPHDSPVSQIPSIAPSAQNSIVEPLPLTKKSTDPSFVPPTAPLVDSRRRNVFTSRTSRRFVR
ncbi:kinesin-domain-containing protein [Macrolepiota fuliginosa MF-IS2]|uniref:Kinesin-domain-containing protein n=1 Tax=Macrolepiota fuliginosa MF-IS2 TaxID=1400762 RepID=A0A9P6CAV6_9AGAR|nr:kinesin-domain-containing protein [Macrolepiota fuliginosa MF-IS2]